MMGLRGGPRRKVELVISARARRENETAGGRCRRAHAEVLMDAEGARPVQFYRGRGGEGSGDETTCEHEAHARHESAN